MNLQDTVALMFPLGVVAQSIPDNSSFFEVNEIPARSVPQNCAMLATGEFQYSRDQDCTGSFLVQAEEHVFFIRIYSTRSSGWHAEVVVRSGFDLGTKPRVN